MGVLDGKVAVVTGGTSGIGAGTVELFVEEGAKVVIAGRRQEEGEALAHKLGLSASFIRADVSCEADVKAMIDHTVAKFGRLDCLFNNAGTPGGPMRSIAEIDLEDFEAVLRVHVLGVALGMKHAAPVMLRQGAGSIINTGSVAGHRGGMAAYSYATAKAAVIHLSRSAAMELGEKGIRVNSISPGAIVTGIFAKGAGMPAGAADRSAESLKGLFATVQPIPRAGLPDDIAHAALFLASDASSFVNGLDLVVDGGLIAGRPWSVTQAERGQMAKQIQSLVR